MMVSFLIAKCEMKVGKTLIPDKRRKSQGFFGRNNNPAYILIGFFDFYWRENIRNTYNPRTISNMTVPNSIFKSSCAILQSEPENFHEVFDSFLPTQTLVFTVLNSALGIASSTCRYGAKTIGRQAEKEGEQSMQV